MATEEIEVTGEEWVKITDPGQSGSCWKKTGNTVVIDHTNQSTAGTLPTSSELVTINKSKRVPLDEDNDNVLGIPADDLNDIYYAISLEDTEDKIVVDVI